MNKLVTVKNKQIQGMIEFLSKLSLSGRASRGRSKLKDSLTKLNEEYLTDIEEIRDPYFKKDNNGKRLIDGDRYVYKSEDSKYKLEKELSEIKDEEVSVSLMEQNQKFEALYHALDDYSETFQNTDADCYDLLMEQLDNIYLEEESNE